VHQPLEPWWTRQNKQSQAHWLEMATPPQELVKLAQLSLVNKVVTELQNHIQVSFCQIITPITRCFLDRWATKTSQSLLLHYQRKPAMRLNSRRFFAVTTVISIHLLSQSYGTLSRRCPQPHYHHLLLQPCRAPPRPLRPHCLLSPPSLPRLLNHPANTPTTAALRVMSTRPRVAKAPNGTAAVPRGVSLMKRTPSRRAS